ncbi:MAG: endolytic transglycosylase MltG [Gammaproteobacteria bacterium]|nr:endolytic transglycosylase MltG [Gammaproteobacteria bacterium]
MRLSPLKPERIWRLLLGFVVLTLLLTTLFATRAWQQLNAPLPVFEPVVFELASGSTLSGVSEQLSRQRLLDHPLVFELWARFTDSAQRLQAGEYEIEPGMTPRQLLEKITSGDVKQYQLTLVEGWTFKQALQAIRDIPGIVSTLQDLSVTEIASQLGLQHSNPEGLIFPDTYYFSKGTTDLEILQRAADRLDSILEESWRKRLGALPIDTPYQALVLASIVEKETAVPEERRRVAGVFVRRLEQGIRLQSDPTVIYGMGESYEGNIDRNALNERTPYNTYRINGLPPTPIALVGKEAIDASLNPEPGDYLYFVSRGDGSHYFSVTLDEHNEAVRRYQLNQQATQD